MGWLIFVIVMIVVFSQLVRGGSKAIKTQMQNVRLPGPYPPGTAPVSQPGNSPTYRGAPSYQPGNPATYQPGNPATYQPGATPTYQPGAAPVYAPGDSATYQPGNAPVYAPGNPPTYAPGTPVGWAPQQPDSTWLPTADDSYQPAYASAVEAATAWRDQQMIDRDQRRAAMTDPQQSPPQGSTAILSTALNTTLATPYQPSSLMSSLSTTLTSSLLTNSSLGNDAPRVVTAAQLDGVAIVQLPDGVAQQVLAHLRNGHEVEAVRMVCDVMNVGLLEATKTVRSYA